MQSKPISRGPLRASQLQTKPASALTAKVNQLPFSSIDVFEQLKRAPPRPAKPEWDDEPEWDEIDRAGVLAHYLKLPYDRVDQLSINALAGFPAAARARIENVFTPGAPGYGPSQTGSHVLALHSDGVWLTRFLKQDDVLHIKHTVPELLADPSLAWSVAAAPPSALSHLVDGQQIVETFEVAQTARSTAANGTTVLRSSAELEQNIFGRRPTADDWTALVGAPPEASIYVFPDPIQADRLRVHVEHPSYEHDRRHIGRVDGGVELEHLLYVLDDRAPAGTGTVSFATSIPALRAHGVNRIKLFAAFSPPEYVGAKVWPKFGFNGAFEKLRTPLPPELAHAKTLFELLAEPTGPAWWDAHAEPMTMQFDLAPTSLSSQVFAAYLRKKGLAALAEGVAS